MAKLIRKLRSTLHITVEGDAEHYLGLRLKAVLTANHKGPSVTIVNARGKGALNVIQTSIRCTRGKAYTTRAVVFDTDTDWDVRARTMARSGGLRVIAMHPCLEAALLNTKGLNVPALTSECKSAFQRAFGGPAHDPGLLDRHFPPAFLINEARACEHGLKILSLFE